MGVQEVVCVRRSEEGELQEREISNALEGGPVTFFVSKVRAGGRVRTVASGFYTMNADTSHPRVPLGLAPRVVRCDSTVSHR